jgi:hypothetical protein
VACGNKCGPWSTIKKAQFLEALKANIEISLLWDITGLDMGIVNKWMEKDEEFLIEIMKIIW